MTNINKEKESLITQVQLKEMLDYNKDTGKFIGIEKDESYFKIAKERIENTKEKYAEAN